MGGSSMAGGGGGFVMLHCIREVQCQQVFTTGFWYLVFDLQVWCYQKDLGGLMVSKSSGLRCFWKRKNMNLRFDFDVMNHLLKNNGGRERRPNIVVLCSMECFQCWRLGCGGLGQRVLYRASRYLVFVFLVKFEDGARRVSPRYHLLFLIWIRRMKNWGTRRWVQNFLVRP